MERGDGLTGIQTAIQGWTAYIEHVTSERFSQRSQSGADNRNRQIHGSVTTHTGGSVPLSAHAKRMVRLILMKYIIN